MEVILFFTGLAVALVGTLAGSGGLIGMPIMLLIGLPIHTAIATAKFSNITSSLSSFVYLVKDKKVTWKECIPILPIALAGGLSGAFLSDKIPPFVLEWMAFFFLIIALCLSLLKGFQLKETKRKDFRIFGFLYFISTYDGLFGPGQATMLMYTHLFHGQSYLKSVALTRFQTFFSCLGAFIVYFHNGHVEWGVALPFALGALIGAQFAVRLATRLSLRHVRILLNILTFILILQLGKSLFF
ncbi:sulfite exporter TauE/SafE family protein [Rossellomorea aquimaris]|uniref:sulfite exporter TauE/SafE family protein n=1 Tax=Rossellomorea TaxID=2837508 RepID=UPI001CD5AC33|nr:sulfite exporter TauE/SafE family protein [Rossellomorea aquimaris]MCA1059355.1 sulfite exporter TauE/SafE family protein [Rossellomorea aquimaris]